MFLLSTNISMDIDTLQRGTTDEVCLFKLALNQLVEAVQLHMFLVL